VHYYQFNIGDYASSTQHLDNDEDLAYRRMIDVYYSKELPLPKDIEKIARLIRMRTHSDCIKIVLQEFFTLEKDGYHSKRIDKDISSFKSKSDKARASAQVRWNKNKDLPCSDGNANASETHSDGNANQEPLTNNHKPPIPYQLIVDAYHEILPELASIKLLNDARKKQIKSRWLSKVESINTVDFWERYFNYVRTSDFLMGRKTDWTANFDFLIKEANLLKTIEGSYDNAS